MALELVKDTAFNLKRQERQGVTMRRMPTPPTAYLGDESYTAVRSYPTVGRDWSAYIMFDREQRIGYWRYYESNVGAERELMQEYLEDIGYSRSDIYSFGEIDRCAERNLEQFSAQDYVLFHVRGGD
jgi:uncharacterized protein YjiS (DUF1127 family)